MSNTVKENLDGEYYINVLEKIHTLLKPENYLEVGTHEGNSLRLSRCASIAVDPLFLLEARNIQDITNKPVLHLYQMGSDDFFHDFSPLQILAKPINFAFLDGMHHCEFLLRDFMNTEAHCKSNSVIVLHDCLPLEAGITARDPAKRGVLHPSHEGWWAGDVWRTALLLKRMRKDLHMYVLDAPPTGLVVITNLDPSNKVLRQRYTECVTKMLNWDLEEIGIDAYFAEMDIQSTHSLQDILATCRTLGADPVPA